MIEHRTTIRVRYAETDQMGVAYYANYVMWMEVGRTELCRAIGVRYRDMEEHDGILLVVAESQCRYISPARYDDEVQIHTWIEQANPRLVSFGYEFHRAADGALLAKGLTRHVYCGRDLRPCKLPPKYVSTFGIPER
jgi:acyl-CoA thioester hydrolase